MARSDPDDVDHGSERFDLDFREVKIFVPKASNIFGVSGSFQIAMTIIGPRVKRTGDDPLVALAFDQNMAAVHADIVESAELARRSARHENQLIENVGGYVVARLSKIAEITNILPRFAPDLLFLGSKDIGIVIIVGR